MVRGALFCLLLYLAGLAIACQITGEREVEVTPGVVPPEIAGAAWDALPVNYCIVRESDIGFTSHDVLVQLTQRAFHAWGVPSTYEGDCDGGIEAGNERNEIGWGHIGASAGSIHQAGETKMHFRRPLLGGGDATIVEADIVIEADPPSGLKTRECLYTTLLHEIGHVLGAHHVEPPAVMAAALGSCPQELTDKDRAMIDALYPDRQ